MHVSHDDITISVAQSRNIFMVRMLEVQGILLSFFEPTKGPVIVCQVWYLGLDETLFAYIFIYQSIKEQVFVDQHHHYHVMVSSVN